MKRRKFLQTLSAGLGAVALGIVTTDIEKELPSSNWKRVCYGNGVFTLDDAYNADSEERLIEVNTGDVKWELSGADDILISDELEVNETIYD